MATLQPVPFIGREQTWASAVGQFILNFGHLEFLVFAYLEKRLPAGEFEKVREKPFHDRIARAGELFGETPERRAAYAVFERALTPVRQLRNHIAHGYFQVVLRPGTNEPVIGITLGKDVSASFAKETHHLTFSELLEQLSALTAVIDHFGRLTDNDAGWTP
jgi:hypothetical protein